MFRLSYVPAFLRSGFPTFWLTYSYFSTYLAPLIVHHQFKRNIYLLFYVIGFFFAYKIIFLFFLLSMQLKHVIVTLLT